MPASRETTLDDTTYADAPPGVPVGLRVVVLWHRDPARIGAQVWVPWSGSGASIELSRQEPVFSDGAPLDDLHISRSPLQLLATPSGLECWPMRGGLRFDVAGKAGQDGASVPTAALTRGVRIGLGRGALLHVRLGPPLRPSPLPELVGASAELEAVAEAVVAAGRSDAPVLITGESGTGKELVAHAIHARGDRAEEPFVAVNAAALSSASGPGQLFGRVRGAFSGADEASAGLFGDAHGGTLFLDEIDACPTDVQAQLLRAIEVGELQVVGGPARRVDVRIVSATCIDLAGACAAGTFRTPLYHRLAHVRIGVPPLRERSVDVAVQAAHFVRVELARRGRAWPGGGDVAWFGREVVEALLDAPWPGNSRELRAAIARMVERDLDRATCGVEVDTRRTDPVAEPSPPPRLHPEPVPQVELHFQISRDQEHVELTVTWGDRSFTPKARVHAYTLLTLARVRLADEQAGALPPEERGWIHRDELCQRLRLDANLLLTHLFRARRQLAEAGMPGADDLFERRLDAGQLRLGVGAVKVSQS
ncbi:MAG: sigma 54-interacting transcriptional regulator [Pseudomonadota bacterium]|nr:sigma 54-interacting transcriptional regulator [Pseudomonadota bacterium]